MQINNQTPLKSYSVEGYLAKCFPASQERDGSGAALEARALARSLCSLGRFEEALQCQARRLLGFPEMGVPQ